LDEVNITLNKDTIPGDKLNAREASGVRIGTAAITTRGMNEDDCKKIANLIFLACEDFQKNKSFIKSEVSNLVSKYPIYQ
jgi:glycine hydroxymethyltransferase